MDSSGFDYLVLIKKAQFGDQKSMSHLAQLGRGRVFAYIYRLTFNHNLAQDLSQETLLEMINSLERLKFEHTNQFWAWLFRTALSKVQLHFRERQHKRTITMSALDEERLSQNSQGDYGDGLKNLISKELSETIFEAMGKLKLRHRNVLALRCFEQMPYSEIATIMDCSEIAAQVLFFRAKHSLKRQLSRHGFGKELLIAALGLFARATAPVEAAQATTTVTAAATKVSLTAAAIGAVGTKIGITTTTAVVATALAAGTITTMRATNDNAANYIKPSASYHISGDPNEATFEYPSSMVGAYDPDNDGWEGRGIKGEHSVVPSQRLVGPPPLVRSRVILPTDHWVELEFPGEIIDGSGADIIITEWAPLDEQARVFITDGAGNEYLLGIAKSERSLRRGQSPYVDIGFDISGIPLPFKPRAVRIVGLDKKGIIPGFDLHTVRARIKAD